MNERFFISSMGTTAAKGYWRIELQAMSQNAKSFGYAIEAQLPLEIAVELLKIEGRRESVELSRVVDLIFA